MSNVRAIGPLYCETPEVSSEYVYEGLSVFPLEPVNAYTSLVPFVLGVVAAVYLYRKRAFVTPILALPTAMMATGLGSMLWHGLRTPTTLFLDWIPAFIAFIIFMFIWPMYVKNRWWGYASLAGIFLFGWLFNSLIDRFIPSNGPPVSIFAAVALVGAVLVFETWRVYGTLAWWAGAVYLAALISAASRVLDLQTCGTLPGFGTHTFWHIGLGFAALFGTVMLVRVRERTQGGS